MRLTPTEIDTIHSTAQAVLGAGARVWLYGSRLDDDRRGGDIDLLIESVPKASVKRPWHCRWMCWRRPLAASPAPLKLLRERRLFCCVKSQARSLDEPHHATRD